MSTYSLNSTEEFITGVNIELLWLFRPPDSIVDDWELKRLFDYRISIKPKMAKCCPKRLQQIKHTKERDHRCIRLNDGITLGYSPVFRSRGSIPLSPVFKPVSDLGGSESCSLCELSLFARVRVRVLEVPLSEQMPGPFFEAMSLLFAIPNCFGQWKLLPYSVFVHWS